MLEVKNYSPLTSMLQPGLDKHGYDYATLILKGKFSIVPGQANLKFSEEPAEIIQGDVHYGEPDKTSIKYESDTAMYKRTSDVVVVGHAYAPGGKKAQAVDVGIQIANRSKLCRVFGNRIWERSSKAIMSMQPGMPELFDKIPLVYENAFGGVDLTNPENKTPEFAATNPYGKGFIGKSGIPKEGFPLPNIEDPRNLIQKIDDHPLPAGFGFIGRAWQPRVALTGTYDAHWQKTRMPLLPLDFNDKYFNGAHPDLIMDKYLEGGEKVTLLNMTPNGKAEFVLPVWKELVTVFMKGNKLEFVPVLDTVVIEPDTNIVNLTWRVTIPCYKQFLYIDTILVGKKKAA